ncbi:helix-turn-helix domain-containing protein [Lactiplantibacillus pentosus]|uniref:helix-turn-helix domain-containing protein n=1 Tax=Lactiplantibacillus pentosus TaxID=1589 RepID=UPI003F53D384
MDSITPKKFGNALKEIRLQKHFSLRQVSQQSKTDSKPAISPSYWSLVERGERNIPKVDTLNRMSKGLRISREEILNLAGLSSANNVINSESSENESHHYNLTANNEGYIDKSLANRISNLRKNHNMKQSDLARQLQLDNSSMSKIENGTRKVSSDEILRIANIFEVSTDYLLGNNEKAHKSPDWATEEDRIDLDKLLQSTVPMGYKEMSWNAQDKEKVRNVIEGIYWDRLKELREKGEK